MQFINLIKDILTPELKIVLVVFGFLLSIWVIGLVAIFYSMLKNNVDE